mmetsp:Transcript_46227/g.93294  ORF Transcript_46227/g.93294 Transcript_46227/m.93294 type:complete len:218 (-) Transcript_46227:274-927(-)
MQCCIPCTWFQSSSGTQQMDAAKSQFSPKLEALLVAGYEEYEEGDGAGPPFHCRKSPTSVILLGSEGEYRMAFIDSSSGALEELLQDTQYENQSSLSKSLPIEIPSSPISRADTAVELQELIFENKTKSMFETISFHRERGQTSTSSASPRDFESPVQSPPSSSLRGSQSDQNYRCCYDLKGPCRKECALNCPLRNAHGPDPFVPSFGDTFQFELNL